MPENLTPQCCKWPEIFFFTFVSVACVAGGLIRTQKIRFLVEKAAHSISGAMLNYAPDRVNRVIPDFPPPDKTVSHAGYCINEYTHH